MQFDHLDKKFREAAEHHHPAYDEKAWANMEKLLDKHMPERDEKRKFLVILLVAAALGIAGLFILQPWKKSSDQLTDNSKSSTPQITTLQSTADKQLQNPVTNPVSMRPEEISGNPGSTGLFTPKDEKEISFYQSKKNLVVNPTKNADKVLSANVDVKQKMNEESKPGNIKTEEVKPTIIKTEAVQTKTSSGIETVANKVVEEAKKTTEAATTSVESSVSKSSNPLTSTKKKKTHELFFSVGGGPDLSFINTSNPGAVKLFGGAGIGYMYNNRISLRAGFYTGRKIYTAAPDDYNAPPVFFTWYPNLQKVDANCEIYEVPISLGYHFARKEKSQLFVSASVSSYFMKKETYNYHYKYTPTGPTVTKERSLYNENTHLFAGVGISGGYTRNITRHVSLTVEPYAKFPVNGIGYGKVKLNSAGVLISAGIHPFRSRNK